jgi:threonyl-tRNA synthetase
VFCTEAQLADECLKINDLILSTYDDFGFTGDLTVKLSTRPEKRVGTDEMWDHAERVMATVLSQIQAQSSNRIKTDINPGEGAFYGPKFEYVLARSISTPTARKRRRSWCTVRSAARSSVSSPT